MGYWKNTDVFPEACEALALKLVQAAGFQQGARVLDIGHGSGESLLFLLSNASVPRPSHLTGITSLKSHHRRSRDRIARLQTDIPVVLHAGDAVCRAGVSDHPFLGKHYDAILALDCAYHFKDRRDFLEQAFNALDPGGSIALADICFAPGSLNSLSTRCITALMRLMPSANVISTDDYLAQMHQIGYTLLRLEDISEDVFPGFTRFLKGRGIGWWAFANVLQLYYWAGARFVLVRGSSGQGMKRN
ncbi:S-adenosyl-L-methionine-dependent methyltransferase [Mycena amicta]|nr:S-adenosyl-L-methionine-dependent methyltransferase [Mycena amicta]